MCRSTVGRGPSNNNDQTAAEVMAILAVEAKVEDVKLAVVMAGLVVVVCC